MEKKYFSLQHSESVIANMASRIFAALYAKGGAEEELIQKSVEIAIKIADLSENSVASDEEWTR